MPPPSNTIKEYFPQIRRGLRYVIKKATSGVKMMEWAGAINKNFLELEKKTTLRDNMTKISCRVPHDYKGSGKKVGKGLATKKK